MDSKPANFDDKDKDRAARKPELSKPRGVVTLMKKEITHCGFASTDQVPSEKNGAATVASSAFLDPKAETEKRVVANSVAIFRFVNPIFVQLIYPWILSKLKKTCELNGRERERPIEHAEQIEEQDDGSPIAEQMRSKLLCGSCFSI